MYYFTIVNNEIIGIGECYCSGEGIDCIEVTGEQYNLATEKGKNYFTYQDGEIILNTNYEQEEIEKEQQRIANLTMTALDFVTFLIDNGLTDEQIDTYLNANKAIKRQLTYCQNVYCGVAYSLMPITIGDITITKEMVIEAFKNKYNEN